MIKVRIPTPLRPLTKGLGEVDAQAHSIIEMIDTLNASHPGIKDRLCDDTGELRRFVNIYVNEEDIRFLKGKEKAIFTGHDLGGPWVFEIVDRHPEKIAGLVVLNTSAYAELMKPPLQARMVGGPLGPMMLKMMGSKIGKPMIHKFFVDFTGTGKALSKDVSYGYWLPLHEGGTRAFRAFAKELKNMMAEFSRYSNALKLLDVPAILIWGDKDPVLRRERMVPRFVSDLKIKPEDVHVLSGASHFLQEDRPDEIAALISSFLRSRSADF